MPTYVYKFTESGETIEVQQAFADTTLTELAHPADGVVRAVRKVFQPIGVTFKGGGFYKNDSRNGSGATASSSSESSSATPSASSSTKDTKSSSESSSSPVPAPSSPSSASTSTSSPAPSTAP